MMTRLPGNHLVEVCDKCLCASCWHGEFMCQQAHHAGIVTKTVDQLDAMNRENPEHYSREKIYEVCGVWALPDTDPAKIEAEAALNGI